MWVGEWLFPSAHPTATFRMVAVSWSLAAFVFFIPFLTMNSRFWRHPAFSFSGQISYSLYLVHPVVLSLLSLIALKGILLICATFILTTVASIVTYQFIELPAIRLGRAKRRDLPLAGKAQGID
jgi:peptidoglycan/LPS O-acetylase OafA/YrhL